MEQNQYLSMFIDESTEHLQAINENLLELEQRPKDVDIVHRIFRSAHTLKGMSATMGFEDMASLTHEMENVLDLVRNAKLEMDAFIFDTLFKGTDALESMLNDIIGGGTGKAEVGPIVGALKAAVSGDRGKTDRAAGPQASAATELDQFQYSVLEQSMAGGLHVFYIETALSETCVLKAARAYMVFSQLEENGEVIKSHPSVEDIEQDKFQYSFSVYYVSKLEQEAVERIILNVSEVESVKIAALDPESLKHMAKEAKAAASQAAVAADAPVQRGETETAAAARANQPAVASRTIRVDLERLDNLMNLFSELLIDRVRLEQLASEIRRNDLVETVEHMARVSGDLQNIVLKLRMVPVDNVFNRFPRMIRDIAKNLGKQVDLVITGADTELDRTVIDEIGDPLVHLLRNAIDHGVESVEKRRAAGKKETGTIHLRAFHSGNHVFIEVEDDGSGINREAVLGKAVKQGIVTQENAAKMTDKEVYQLLFSSGFSTADKISDISGRGVGLDVVKTKIESLGGHVEVESGSGAGTKFSVQLPLTLSIISAMLIRAGEERYAIPLSSIVETMAVDRAKIREVHGTTLLDYRQKVIPLLYLGKVFDIPGWSQEGTEVNLAVVRKGDKLLAIVVDDFIGQQEIVLKTLGKYLSQPFAVSGATILGDGQVALILDPNALIQ